MWISDPKKDLWAGDEDALEHAHAIAARINATEPQAFFGSDDGDVPSLLTKVGDVGVIDINGTLYTSAPDWAKAIFGVTDYPQISEALVQAARDPEIGSILLNVNSPGGAVNGVTAVADLVRRIDKDLKPVVSHANGRMASAAYWIGSGARSVSVGDVSEIGSVGVITTHADITKSLEKEGTTVTVLRAGQYKALGNPYEPLSPLARNDIQSKLDYSYSMFLNAVADSRGMSYPIADQKIGQGRVFIGQQGVEAGAADEVLNLEQALTKAQELASQSLDKRKSLINNRKSLSVGDNMKKKALLTEQDIAALASGAPLEPQAPETPAEVAAETPAEVAAEVATEVEAEPVADAKADVKEGELVDFLRAELRAKDADLLASRLDLAKANEKLEALTASQDGLVAIARDSVQKMHIALGQAGAHVASLSVTDLLAEHTRVGEAFKEKFKVGGVAASSVAEDSRETSKSVNPVQKARVAATRTRK